jgi:hypothetical protein
MKIEQDKLVCSFAFVNWSEKSANPYTIENRQS